VNFLIGESADNRFRITDWHLTFQEAGSEPAARLSSLPAAGLGFTYSNFCAVHRIKPWVDKAAGLLQVLHDSFPIYLQASFIYLAILQ